MRNHVVKITVLLFLPLLPASWASASGFADNQVQVASGILQGAQDATTGVRMFKGVPFAQPPVGELRWKEPQPAAAWSGVRPALAFSPSAMQQPLYSDMRFRSQGTSEDCLYLNVWTPAKTGTEKLPVLVYYYGGGFSAGDGSELRYDGASLAARGIVTVTVNYRLGVFGFFAHPELTMESPHHASGNYGFLDQVAALQWVRANIAAFGGDPKHLTIAGESAGSISVAALMASPLSRDLIVGAIGESGATFSYVKNNLAQAEEAGVKEAAGFGAGTTPTVAQLRALTAEQLLQAAGRNGNGGQIVDGYFFPKDPAQIYAAGEQARVPLLAGSNSAEQAGNLGGRGGRRGGGGRAANAGAAAGTPAAAANPLVDSLKNLLATTFPSRGEEAFKYYGATTDAEARQSADDLASDRFIAFGTWKWMDTATKTGGQPTYYYWFDLGRPPAATAAAATTSAPRPGAVHSTEIEYALGNLPTNPVYAWTADDYKVSTVMEGYFENFIKTGNPNGAKLPEWPKFASGQRMIIGLTTAPQSEEKWQARYQFYEQALPANPPARGN